MDGRREMKRLYGGLVRCFESKVGRWDGARPALLAFPAQPYTHTLLPSKTLHHGRIIVPVKRIHRVTQPLKMEELLNIIGKMLNV